MHTYIYVYVVYVYREGLGFEAVHKLLPAHKTSRNKRTKSNAHKNCTAGSDSDSFKRRMVQRSDCVVQRIDFLSLSLSLSGRKKEPECANKWKSNAWRWKSQVTATLPLVQLCAAIVKRLSFPKKLLRIAHPPRWRLKVFSLPLHTLRRSKFSLNAIRSAFYEPLPFGRRKIAKLPASPDVKRVPIKRPVPRPLV